LVHLVRHLPGVPGDSSHTAALRELFAAAGTLRGALVARRTADPTQTDGAVEVGRSPSDVEPQFGGYVPPQPHGSLEWNIISTLMRLEDVGRCIPPHPCYSKPNAVGLSVIHLACEVCCWVALALQKYLALCCSFIPAVNGSRRVGV